MFILPLLAGAVLAAAIIVALARIAASPRDGAAIRDRHGLMPQWVGIGAGAIAALTVVLLGDQRLHLAFTLTPLVGAGWLVGLLVSERTRPVPAGGAVVSADLARRTPSLYLERGSLPVMRMLFAITAIVLFTAIATQSSADPTQFERACSARLSGSAGPWPGTPYAVPGLVALAAAWILTEIVLRRIAARPAAQQSDRSDRDLRALTSRTALVSATLIAAPNLGVAMVTMGGALGRVCSGTSSALGTLVLIGGLLVVCASAGAWLVVLVTGGRGVVVPPRPAGS